MQDKILLEIHFLALVKHAFMKEKHDKQRTFRCVRLNIGRQQHETHCLSGGSNFSTVLNNQQHRKLGLLQTFSSSSDM